MAAASVITFWNWKVGDCWCTPFGDMAAESTWYWWDKNNPGTRLNFLKNIQQTTRMVSTLKLWVVAWPLRKPRCIDDQVERDLKPATKMNEKPSNTYKNRPKIHKQKEIMWIHVIMNHILSNEPENIIDHYVLSVLHLCDRFLVGSLSWCTQSSSGSTTKKPKETTCRDYPEQRSSAAFNSNKKNIWHILTQVSRKLTNKSTQFV